MRRILQNQILPTKQPLNDLISLQTQTVTEWTLNQPENPVWFTWQPILKLLEQDAHISEQIVEITEPDSAQMFETDSQL